MVRLSLVVVALLVACKQKESVPVAPQPTAQPTRTPKVGAPVARGTLRRTKVETMYAVVAPGGADLAALERLAQKKGSAVEVKRMALTDVFSDEHLAFVTRDFSPAEADAVKKSSGMIVLHVSGTDAMKLAREIAGVARDVADAAHGWVLDPELQQLYAAAAFHEHVPGEHPDARKLIVVHSIMGGGEQPFLDTAGLRRYGLPELYVAEATAGSVNQVTHLINAAAQELLDGGDVNERGELAIVFRKLGWQLDIIEKGTGKAVWKARWAKEPDAEGDAELVVELLPASGAGTEGMYKMIGETFGAEPEKVTSLKADDPDILAAAARARADLAKLRPHFAQGVPLGERLTIKAKFTEDEEVEWMWVDVVAFKGDSLSGTLANTPELVTNVREGQKVKVKLADVGDYLHETKDGTRSGGYSIEVMKKRGLLPADY
jgi:uncharacterized protein YegJ (DUF2314 family)